MSAVRETWNLACPFCVDDHHLQIEIVVMASLSVDGTGDFGDRTWDVHGSVAGFDLPSHVC